MYNKGIYDDSGGTSGFNQTLSWNYDCPPDHAVIAENVTMVGYGQPQSRMRFGAAGNLDPLTNVIRIWEYRKSPTQSFKLVLTYDGANGRIYKSTDTATPILGPIAGMADFSICVIFGRCYITPHDRSFGLVTQDLYVWDGVGATAWVAGPGSVTATPNLTIVNGAAGNIELGEHLFAVAAETDTGAISKPGRWTLFTADGTHKVDVSNIPAIGGHIVAYHLLATPIIFNYDGNVNNQPLYFVPNGRTTATSITGVNFYDAELTRSADYLKDQLATIPSGVAIGMYGTRMAVVGTLKLGSQTPPIGSNVALLSKPSEPESFDSADCFVTITDKSGGGLKNLCELNGSLYLFRDSATYGTRDNGDSPSTWSIEQVDGGLGAGCFGVATVSSGVESTSDVAVVATRCGLFLFNGNYATVPISWKISGLWDALQKSSVSFSEYYKLQVAVVAGLKSIFVSRLPTDSVWGDEHCFLMCCDFTRGFGFEDVEWTLWSTARAPSGSSRLQMVSITSEINFDVLSSNVRNSLLILVRDSSQIATQQYGWMNGLAGPDGCQESGILGPQYIPWDYRLGYTAADPESNIMHFSAIRIYQMGSASGHSSGINVIAIAIGHKVGGEIVTVTQELMGSSDYRSKTYLMNLKAERVSLGFSLLNAINDTWRLSRIVIFGKTSMKDVAH